MLSGRFLWVVLGSLTLVAVGLADTIDLATGLDSNGKVATAGKQLDSNWKVTHANKPLKDGSGYTVVLGNADFYGGWAANGPKSAWICANPDDATGNGTIVATRTFNLAANQAANAVFSGIGVALDDSGSVVLNGKVIAKVDTQQWGAIRYFPLAPDLLTPGENTLQVKVDSSDNNLEAVRFEGILTVPAATPWFMTPFGIVVLVLILVGVIYFATRRKKPGQEGPVADPVGDGDGGGANP